MELNKYVGNYLKSKGINRFENGEAELLKSCKPFSVDDLTELQLDFINKVIDVGIGRNYHDAVVYYFLDKYENTQIYQAVNDIIENDSYEYADNIRISDGSAVDEIVYATVRFYGCCGFYDDVVTIDGVEYRIGFNYGH